MFDSSVSSTPTPPPHEDSSSPFFLHHGDSPETLLVTQVLNGENYHTWRRSMSMALTAKNKIRFVDGSILKPSASSPQFSSWIRCNNMVLSWLLNSLSKEIAASVIYEDSAMSMWCDLKDRFS
ncbi:hypothetical protein F2P56_002942 [Juglans regia]|uniref:Retrotransposon Copia-like N-terminal domain-containing protein n=1 Tax=Juglans regia TaxID=51240 RepID=A0A833YE02_JUGRE|nr:hypothetical protein F2P56_002942 [Juglans regia]